MACFTRAMALQREAGSDVLARYSPSRQPAVAGARKAHKVRDKRRREYEQELPPCAAQMRKAAKKRKPWEVGIAREAGTTVGAHLGVRGHI